MNSSRMLVGLTIFFYIAPVFCVQKYEGTPVDSADWINKKDLEKEACQVFAPFYGQKYFEPLIASKDVFLKLVVNRASTAQDYEFIVLDPVKKNENQRKFSISAVVFVATIAFFLGGAGATVYSKS